MAVNYLTKPPPPVDEYYYEEDSYAEKTGFFWPNALGYNQENWRQGQEIKVGNTGITIKRVTMFEMTTTTTITTLTRVTMVTETIEWALYSTSKLGSCS